MKENIPPDTTSVPLKQEEDNVDAPSHTVTAKAKMPTKVPTEPDQQTPENKGDNGQPGSTQGIAPGKKEVRKRIQNH